MENQSILLSLGKLGPGRARTCLGLPFWLAVRWVCKLQYFGHLMRGTDSLEKTLMLAKIEGGSALALCSP